MANFYHESCRSQKEVMWMLIKGNIILQLPCKRNAMLTLRNTQLCFPYLLLRWNQSPWNHRASDAPIYHLDACSQQVYGVRKYHKKNLSRECLISFQRSDAPLSFKVMGQHDFNLMFTFKPIRIQCQHCQVVLLLVETFAEGQNFNSAGKNQKVLTLVTFQLF